MLMGLRIYAYILGILQNLSFRLILLSFRFLKWSLYQFIQVIFIVIVIIINFVVVISFRNFLCLHFLHLCLCFLLFSLVRKAILNVDGLLLNDLVFDFVGSYFNFVWIFSLINITRSCCSFFLFFFLISFLVFLVFFFFFFCFCFCFCLFFFLFLLLVFLFCLCFFFIYLIIFFYYLNYFFFSLCFIKLAIMKYYL
jgi:hypothetical protein